MPPLRRPDYIRSNWCRFTADHAYPSTLAQFDDSFSKCYETVLVFGESLDPGHRSTLLEQQLGCALHALDT